MKLMLEYLLNKVVCKTLTAFSTLAYIFQNIEYNNKEIDLNKIVKTIHSLSKKKFKVHILINGFNNVVKH